MVCGEMANLGKVLFFPHEPMKKPTVIAPWAFGRIICDLLLASDVENRLDVATEQLGTQLNSSLFRPISVDDEVLG